MPELPEVETVVRTLEKQGIKLTKVGRGQNADYTIEYVNKE